MHDAINSPAWGILDDWRAAGPDRRVGVNHSADGYLLTASDYGASPHVHGDKFCQRAAELGDAARSLVVAMGVRRQNARREEIDRLRAKLAEAERAELEAASSVECAASHHDRAPDAERAP